MFGAVVLLVVFVVFVSIMRDRTFMKAILIAPMVPIVLITLYAMYMRAMM